MFWYFFKVHSILFAHKITNEVEIIIFSPGKRGGQLKVRSKGVSDWRWNPGLGTHKEGTCSINAQGCPMWHAWEYPVWINQPQSSDWGWNPRLMFFFFVFFFFLDAELSFQTSRHTPGYTCKTHLQGTEVWPETTENYLPQPPYLLQGENCCGSYLPKVFSSSNAFGTTVMEQMPCLGERTFSCMCRGQNHMGNAWP